jgi:hypothetical protein
LVLGLTALSATLSAAQTPKLDLGVTYSAARSLKAATGQNFWMQGGSIELGANVWKGLGIGANVTGLHSTSIGSSGVPVSLVTATFGPRYRWHAEHKFSAYGEALVGEVNGFRSLFPTPYGAQTEANGLALQVGGGVDYAWKKHIAVRLVNVSWLRTQLPNATDNVQNTLALGSGIVLKFGK